MRKPLSYIFILAVLSCSLFSFSSCSFVESEYRDGSNEQCFEALWRLMDEHYCFFDYKKQELGVDWDEVHARYSRQVNEDMNNAQLFEVLCNMIGELKDGHVNISSSFDYGRNWSFYEDYPLNYNDSIVNLYLGNDYQMASSLKYNILDDNIGYVRCESFADGIGSGNVDAMLYKLTICRGVIIDVRGNGGGMLSQAEMLASHFTDHRILIGYISHKTGKGRNQFSSPKAQYLEPTGGILWQKPVVVLTNRGCYSATNDFVKCMKLCPQVKVMGDKTGGGSGMPFNSELPNGWAVRYSAVVFYDADMRQTEFGIEPHFYVSMSGADTSRQKDTLIESAREYINSQYK